MEINPKYTTLIVNNLEKSMAFYHDIIGWETIFTGEIEESGKVAILQGTNGNMIHLVESVDYSTGIYAVGAEVDNIEETVAYLEQNGINPTPIITTPLGKETFIQDINGIRICLIEHSVKF